MATIAEIREKYPQYSDLSDEQLAKGLHQKFYSDLPFEDFAGKIGFASEASYIVDGKVVKKSEIAPNDPRFYNVGDAAEKELAQGSRDLLRAGALTGRTIMNTVAGAPLLAMNAGVAARNLITGDDYTMPSQMWNEALNAAGIPEPETGIEKGVDIAGQALLGSKFPAPSVANKAPPNFDPRTIRDLTLAASQKAGYVVPPSQANPTATNRILEGLAGKAKVQQAASAQNQNVTNQLAMKALGVTDQMNMTPSGMSQLRADAATAYAPLRQIGTMRADAQYLDDVAEVGARFKNVAKDFPALTKTEILKVVDGMPKKSFDSNSAVDALTVLRDSADDAYRSGNGTLGKAYKDLSKALEGAIERGLQRRGEEATEVLKSFREARATIAKTHSVEKALNPATGNVDALKLAQQLGRKPLSGELASIANFGKAAPKSAREVTDNIPSISPLDAYASAGTSLATDSALPLIYPFTREALRSWLLSPGGQQFLARSGRLPGTAVPMGSVGAGAGVAGLLGSQ